MSNLDKEIDETIAQAIKFSVNGQIDNITDLNVSGTRTNVAISEAREKLKSLIADDRKKMLDEIDDIAEGLSIPSITTWRQGRFIDSPKYYKMGDKWRHEQEEREKTLIRPYGGTNNALFQVSGYVDNEVIAEYLEAVGKVLRQRAKEWSKRND